MLDPDTSFRILACPLACSVHPVLHCIIPEQAMKHPSPEAQSMLFGYFELKAMSAVVPTTQPLGEDGRWF